MNPFKLVLPIALSALLLGGLVSPEEALADPAADWRCASDRLDAAVALQRLEWARRCALTQNTAGASSWVSSTRAFDTSFNWAKEYVENNPNRAFSGNLNAYNINYYYAYARYETTPIYTVFQETSGPTIGFWKWSHSTARARALYPVFETSPVAGGGSQLFPLPTMPGSGCDLFARNPTTGSFTRWTGNFYVIAYCVVDP